MVKVKTSIYIDRELWEKFKKYVSRKGVDLSNFLEELIKDALIEESLSDLLLELAGYNDYEIDFEPVEPRKGSVSELVRVLRDERGDRLSR